MSEILRSKEGYRWVIPQFQETLLEVTQIISWRSGYSGGPETASFTCLAHTGMTERLGSGGSVNQSAYLHVATPMIVSRY